MGKVPRLIDVPLADLLGTPLPEGVKTRLAVAADRLEVLPHVVERHGWWFPPDSESPGLEGGRRTLTSTVLTAWRTADDWLEMGIDIARDAAEQVWVTADVGIACMCETDHNMHYVHQAEWLAASPDALASALESAVEVLSAWFREPGVATPWRVAAGLPDST
jgi:hypothetical protein